MPILRLRRDPSELRSSLDIEEANLVGYAIDEFRLSFTTLFLLFFDSVMDESSVNKKGRFNPFDGSYHWARSNRVTVSLILRRSVVVFCLIK